MRIAVLGAAGPTGRHLVEQAGAAGHDVTAVVRRPGPHPEVRTVLADATDPDELGRAVADQDAVLSALGTRPSLRAISLYSDSAAAIVTAMRRHGVGRLIAVTSSVLDPRWRPSGEPVFNAVIDPLINRRVARTAHHDMRRMEAHLAASDLEWTTARPSGLFDHPTVTAYRTASEVADGLYTARVDLAAAMVAELADRRFVRRPLAVITTDVRPRVAALIGAALVSTSRADRPSKCSRVVTRASRRPPRAGGAPR